MKNKYQTIYCPKCGAGNILGDPKCFSCSSVLPTELLSGGKCREHILGYSIHFNI